MTRFGKPLRRLPLERIAQVMVAVSLLAAGAALVLFIADYAWVFVHPHRSDNHVPALLGNHVGFGLSDLLAPFQEFAPGEHRPRFLTYALILLDLRLRMLLYDTLVLHPTFSVAWILQLVVGPYLMFRLIANLTSSRLAGAAATAVYVSSIGFLSGFTMYFTPGKPLSNVGMLVGLYCMSRIAAYTRGTQLYRMGGRRERWMVTLSTLGGLLLDEMPLFVVPLLPLCFPQLFFSPKHSASDQLRNLMAYLLPVGIFLIIVLVAVPLLTSHFFDYRFNYLGSLMAVGNTAAGAKLFYEGPYGGFGLSNFVQNLSTLFGVSLVPWQLAPFIKHASAGGVISGQSTGLFKLAVLAAFTVGTIVLARGASGQSGALFRRLTFAAALFVLFISLLSGRHVPFVTGYYYGCAFAVFFSALVGFGFAELARRGAAASLGAALAVLLMVAVQIDNFIPIDRSYIEVHNEGMARHAYENKLRLAGPTPLTRSELDAIWSAWKRGGLSEFLATTPISTGAIFLVVELQWRDRARLADAQ